MVGFIELVLILVLIAVVLACLLGRRTRAVGVALAAIIGLAMIVAYFSVSHSPRQRSTIVAYNGWHGELHSAEAATVSEVPLGDAADMAAVQKAQAEHRAEIMKNQRLAARMGDAIAQRSPDGSWLETYPDGMQVKQDYAGHRSIIRPADADGHNFYGGAHGGGSYTRTTLAGWLFVTPFAVLLAAFLILRARKREESSGVGWTIAGAAALLFAGFFFVGTQRVSVQTGREVQVLAGNAHPGNLVQIEAETLDGQAEVIAQLQAAATSRETVESVWSKLTGPKINLGVDTTPEADASRQELAAAAKTILAASAPGADPFTQGWLLNAAKSIVSAASRSGDAQAEAAISAVAAADYAAAPPLQVTGAEEVTPVANAAEKKGKPDWIESGAQLVGNTRRVVVSTDPFITPDESYAALRSELDEVVHGRVKELAEVAHGRDYANLVNDPPQVPELDHLGISTEYILAELCPEQYLETINLSVGEMKVSHALVEFNETQDQYLLDRWLAYARVQSIEVVAVMSTLAVAGLALVYGLLRLDTWTRGYYTKRLFLGVPAAIIAVFAVATLFGA